MCHLTGKTPSFSFVSHARQLCSVDARATNKTHSSVLQQLFKSAQNPVKDSALHFVCVFVQLLVATAGREGNDARGCA